MKNRFIYVGALALTFMSTGCEEEFLDKQPTEQLTPEQIGIAAETDPSLLNAFTAGLYSTMYNTGTGGTTGHDDFGQKGYDIYSDMLASDMVLSAINYGWYSTVARYQASTNNTIDDNYQPWRYYYRIIFGANTLIEILGGNDAEPDTPEMRYIMGQAKAMRAYSYFYLAQFYSEGYRTGSEKILPIYTDTQTPAQPLSTSEEVYSLIISDLNEAITLLDGFERSAKNEVNQEVAKGLLSYTLAARGTQADLQRVVELTNDIITDGGFSLMTENQLVAKYDAAGNITNRNTAGFNDVSNQSWIWGVDLTLDINLDLISWWGQVDLYTYSYAWAGDPKAIDASLYAAIPAGDIRKAQFVPTTNSRNLMPLNKFFAPDRVIGGQRNVVTDYVYMRLEEIYLLNAEAKARLGMDAEAREMLKMFVDTRVEDASYIDALSGQALIDEIFLQTRIELWGEGKSYLAMKRLKKSITRGANHLFFPGETFAWDSDELTFPIPQAEILNNPALNQ